MSNAGHYCSNCKKHLDQHADLQCLFEPTTFFPMTFTQYYEYLVAEAQATKGSVSMGTLSGRFFSSSSTVTWPSIGMQHWPQRPWNLSEEEQRKYIKEREKQNAKQNRDFINERNKKAWAKR